MSSAAQPRYALLSRPSPDRRLGPYKLVRQLGRGGFAPVWLAEETYDGKKLREVAVKLFFTPSGLLLSSPEAASWRDKVLNEARALCRVEHPAVVRFYALVQDDESGAVGLVMENVPGRSLDKKLADEGMLDEDATLDIAIWVAWALAAVHHAGLVHRDVKPANIIEAASGCKLIDFGIAAAAPETPAPEARSVAPGHLGGSANAGGASASEGVDGPTVDASKAPPLPPQPLVGTIGYMAPECFLPGAVATPASDLYALGATIFKLMTGLVPAQAIYAQAAREGREPYPSPSAAPPPRLSLFVPDGVAPSSALSDLTDALLAPDRSGRPHHAEWVARELEAIRDHKGRRAPRSSALLRGPESSPVTSRGPSTSRTMRRVLPGEAPEDAALASEDTALAALFALESSLPEPLALLCERVRRAERARRDRASGAAPDPGHLQVTKGAADSVELPAALGELALGALRYAFAVGLALLDHLAPGRAHAARGPLQDQLRSAVRPTHTSWCYLLGSLHEALLPLSREIGDRFAFATEMPIADRLGGLFREAGTREPAGAGARWVTELLEASAGVLGLPLCVPGKESSVAWVEPRMGVRGAASHASGPASRVPSSRTPRSGRMPPESAPRGEPCVVLGDLWLRVSPWLPHEAGRILLPEAPSAPLRPWRSIDPESGERRDDPRLDWAVRRFAGVDLETPRELCQTPALTGRDDVLAMIRAAARGGGVRAVVLTGPLGIGRTRLLAAAIELAEEARRIVLRMQGSPERQSPMRPLLRAIDAAKGEAAAALAPVRAAVERALSPAGAGSSDMVEAIEAVEEALCAASAGAPILLAFDDLQWADAHSLTLLRLLVDRAGAGAAGAEADPDPTGGSPGDLLVVATARDEPTPAPPLRALLSALLGKVRSASSRRVQRIVLGPLTAEQTATVAQAVGPIAPELERAVVRGSGCVPFFVVHPLLVWRETGAIAWRDGAWHAVGGADGPVFRQDVPGALDLIEARLASYFDLGSDRGRVALRVLACVGLYGGGLGIEVLLEVAGDEAAVEGVLEVLVGGGILTVEGERQEYSFAQEMVRQAALNLVRQRPWFRRLHRALLDAVAAGPFALADAAFLAEGYQQIGAPEPALLWLRRAMDAALGAGLFSDAAELGDRLAALTLDAAERADIELVIVRALVRGRKFEEARGRIERLSARAGALASAPGGLALDVRRRIYKLEVARGFRELHEDPDPALLDDADRAGDAALRCEARMALAGVLPEARAMALAGEAIRLAGSCDPLLEVSARVLRFELCYDSSHRDLALAEEDLTRAVALAAASSSPWQELQIEGDLAAIEAETGRLDSAIDRLGRLVESAEERKLRGQLRLFLQNLSALLLRAGRPAEAAEVAGRTAALAIDAGDPALRGSALSLRAEALKLAGSLDEALATVDEAARIQRQHGDHALPLALLRRASILEALGRADAALVDVREARRLAGLYGNKDLEIGARVAEKLSAARNGEISGGELAQVLAEAEGSGVTLRKVTLGIIASARDWLSGDSPTVPQDAAREPAPGHC